MTAFRRPRWAPLVVVAATALCAGALVGLPPPSAHAFFAQTHERITRDALARDGVAEIALIQILNGPPPGGGALGSDLFPNDEWRHIDNARNPSDICARAQRAWNTFVPIILSGSQPAGPGSTVLANGIAARAAFGGLLHAQQDFYAHSNWAEDNIAAGQLERLAPPIFPTCNPADFPADLHTGYFNTAYSQRFPLDGCPPGGPPPGFRECHSTMNKDGPDTARGSQPVSGSNMKMFDLAALLATTATADLSGQIRNLVANTVSAQHPGIDGQCVATKLFEPDLLQPCAIEPPQWFSWRSAPNNQPNHS